MTTPLPTEGRREIALSAALIVLAACVPYLSTINDYFLQDDFGVVQLMARRSWTMFFKWFTMPWTENIWLYTPDEVRPFVALSYVFTASWGAASPIAHHALNIAIHAGNGLLVLQMARAVAGLRRPAATLAALVFVLLPVQAESVAWITGRVDSMPTLFYFAAFLAYARWRTGATAAYWWALIWFFVALFSKQNTITLPAALVAYDWLVLRRPVRPALPFMLMTIGFLGLRYATVGTVVRESTLNAEGLRIFGDIVLSHTGRLVVGHSGAVRVADWLGLAALAAVATGAFWRLLPVERGRLAAAAIFFGVVWSVLGFVPIIAAGYDSPRHVYLAAAGWAIFLGVVFEALTSTVRSLRWRRFVHAGATVVLVFYGVQLWGIVSQWNTAAHVSQLAVAGLEREVLASPPGTLMIVGVPVRSWEWAVPFSAQPPYTATALTDRALIVTPWLLHCCRSQWLEHTRQNLRTWAEQPQPAPVVALYFDPETGVMSRRSDIEYPALRGIVQSLVNQDRTGAELDQILALDRPILRILHELVAPVRPPAGELRIR